MLAWVAFYTPAHGDEALRPCLTQVEWWVQTLPADTRPNHLSICKPKAGWWSAVTTAMFHKSGPTAGEGRGQEERRGERIVGEERKEDRRRGEKRGERQEERK